MASLEEELLLDEEENRRELAFIREQIPFDAKKHYSDSTILYIMDLIVDYYYTSGILKRMAREPSSFSLMLTFTASSGSTSSISSGHSIRQSEPE